jgi:hypothetical protein
VLVAGGSHDLIIPTVNAIRLAQRLPNAQLILIRIPGTAFSSNITRCSASTPRSFWRAERAYRFIYQ